MATRPPALRTLLRSTTLRATSTPASTTLSPRLPSRAYSRLSRPARAPTPPPPYQAQTRNISIRARPITQIQLPLRSELNNNSRSQQQERERSRTPSPAPAYQIRNISLLASPGQWTRFDTPYSLSSVRTFTRSSVPLQSHSPSPTPSTTSTAASEIDPLIDEITDLYGTARDEFEIATEETEKNTTYAADDRAAAREELDRLLKFYTGILEGEDRAIAEEVKRRVGQRVRELEMAVLRLEDSVVHGD